MWQFPDILIPVAVILLAGLAWRGYLSERRLRSAPRRELPITWLDLVAGLALPVGLTLWAAVRSLTSPDAPPAARPPEAAPLTVRLAVHLLTGQLLVQLPALAVFVARARAVPGGWVESGLLPRRPGRDAAWALTALMLSVPLVLGVMQLTLRLGEALRYAQPDDGHAMLRMMRESTSPTATALLVIGAVVLAPLLEEITFRGLLQTGLLRWFGPDGRWPVVLIAGAVFGAVHGQAAAWQALPALFVLGLVLGWLYERTGSLLPCVALHAGFNAANVGLLFVGA